MFRGKRVNNHPLEYCVPCSEATPHRYERLGVYGQLTSKAICLVCNNDSRGRPFRKPLRNLLHHHECFVHSGDYSWSLFLPDE